MSALLRGRSMNTRLLMLAITVMGGSPFFSNPAAGQFTPAAKKAGRVQITNGPEIESSINSLTIIRWTSNNPGGSPEHFGVVHYGTDPKNLVQTAKSHIRLNQTHSYTVFRVRVDGLAPKTTYYYKVDSADANGASDGVVSPIKTFTTP
jgi:phosphodiesterase/alkaline phosphatase D-like protein